MDSSFRMKGIVPHTMEFQPHRSPQAHTVLHAQRAAVRRLSPTLYSVTRPPGALPAVPTHCSAFSPLAVGLACRRILLRQVERVHCHTGSRGLRTPLGPRFRTCV